MHSVVDCGVQHRLNMNSDHRAVYLEVSLGKRAVQRWRRKAFKRKQTSIGWQPVDVNEYKHMLDQQFVDIDLEWKLRDKRVSLDEAASALH